ncbi:hypothetical protein [Microcoleus sp.]|uniref:hypothetical protein n=1 Tax=Microcoleus sp. TaxID=44472 RepID=UPI003C775544
MSKINEVQIVIASYLIPLTICLIAWWVSSRTDNRTLDGIPAPLAAIVGVCSLIWLVAVCPWPVELGLMLAVLVLGRAYLQNILNAG